MPSVDDILAVILGGGRGSRLSPLTKMRSNRLFQWGANTG